MGIDKGHVRGLAQTLRTVGDLDPVLVWREADNAGQPTGRHILLDGRHRLAAYATAKRGREGVPAAVLTGDRAEAMLAAVRANSREHLPLTKSERMDAAWRLVRLPGKRLTVPTVARAAGVAPRTVDNMRKRWSVMQAAGKDATGQSMVASSPRRTARYEGPARDDGRPAKGCHQAAWRRHPRGDGQGALARSRPADGKPVNNRDLWERIE